MGREAPHREPYFQEVPFHIRWPASHPASTPILIWLEERGRLMTEEEEKELDQLRRSANKAKSRLTPEGTRAPRMLSPDEVESQLLGEPPRS